MASPPPLLPPPPPPALPPRLGPSQGDGPPPVSSSSNSVVPGNPLAPPQVSPWYARFGPFETEKTDQIFEGPPKHSGVAPMHPGLHPRFYGDLPDQSEVQHAGYFRDGAEADLFYMTLYNRWNILGRKTHWQCGVMNRHVKFGDRFGLISGGHRKLASGLVPVHEAADPKFVAGHVAQVSGSNDLFTYEKVFDKIYELERIEVDETKWFGFLNKDRWYNCHTSAADGRYWSIDDSEASSDSISLHTVLYGLLGPWDTVVDHFWPDPKPPSPYSNTTVLISYDTLKHQSLRKGVVCPLDVVVGLGPDEWRSRLEDLLRDLT
ncbi:hypothetical protein F5Y18DRAFT_431132 [Xylariaceae sp. FL1019]|nr:hypothetical protein F5Y18DRAFT_431132 [Xylariaceae sp. FL1019]